MLLDKRGVDEEKVRTEEIPDIVTYFCIDVLSFRLNDPTTIEFFLNFSRYFEIFDGVREL